MLSRRQFMGGLLASGVAGCAADPSSAGFDSGSSLSLLSKTLASKTPPPGRYPLSSTQILDIPYATLGVRIDENPRVVMVLATIEGKTLQWVSADFVRLDTRNGWLLKTHGLQRDLAATRWLPALDQDPLRSFVQTGALPAAGRVPGDRSRPCWRAWHRSGIALRERQGRNHHDPGRGTPDPPHR